MFQEGLTCPISVPVLSKPVVLNSGCLREFIRFFFFNVDTKTPFHPYYIRISSGGGTLIGHRIFCHCALSVLCKHINF